MLKKDSKKTAKRPSNRTSKKWTSFGTKPRRKSARTQTASPFEIWGLTGGVASGKSTAARIFAELGLPVLDADQISRDLSGAGGAAFPAIVQRFGTADRAELRRKIFTDPTARRDLEAILHPLIQTESLNRMKAMAAQLSSSNEKPFPVIYEAALLIETGRYKNFAGLIVVESPRELREQRLVARDQIDRVLATRMINSQISDEERRAVATTVIRNDGTLEDLKQRVSDFARAQGWIG